MTGVYADLHVHTTRSDGQLPLTAVPAAARRAGVTVVGLTDHDRRQPLPGPAVRRGGVLLVHGIELRVAAGDMRVDLLGYGVTPTPALEGCLERIQTNRRERARAIVELVEDHRGVDLDVSIHDGVGRPHIARAIDAHPEIPLDYQGAFDELIGEDGPCYVARDVPSLERGRRILAGASRLVALAHPLRYPDTERALEIATELGAIEGSYPYGRSVDEAAVQRTVRRHDLLVTGGSDAHDSRLGQAGLTSQEYERLPLPAGPR